MTQPGGLAERLRATRLRAALTGTQLAAQNGWPQSKVSKIENGRQAPTSADVRAWLTTCGADQAELAEMLGHLERLSTRHHDWRRRMRQGLAQIQSGYNDLIRDAASVRDFTLAYVPSELQTADYARVVIGEGAALHGAPSDQLDGAVTARMQRQQYLYDHTKQFEFLLAEPVLRWVICPLSVMLGQMDRLLAVVSGMSNIRFGILPTGIPLAVTPQNSFSLIDDVAYVETFVGEAVHYGDEAVAYHRVMDRLWDDAVTGEQARKLIVSAAQALQELIAAEPD
ncbi:MAG: helix-turn-helix domain-containing protein [Micromonosporaceae bacterium]